VEAPMKIFEFLADATAEEGVDTLYTVMGDGNMAWAAALEVRARVRIVSARHEAAAIAMADGHARVTNEVALASVTCGPGLTQILTSLTAAVRRKSPLVIFVGESPIHEAYHLQYLDQGPLVASVGAEYLRVTTLSEVPRAIARAFHTARTRSIPVVVGVPYDLQEEVISDDVKPLSSKMFDVDAKPASPNGQEVEALLERLLSAESPVLLAGAGAVKAECRDDIVALSQRTGAHLATTLRALNLFDGEPNNLGIAGGFSSAATREVLASADLIVALGASMSYHTTVYGRGFSPEVVVQVDTDPVGRNDGLRVAGKYIRADAGELVRALLERIPQGNDAPPLPQAKNPRETTRNPLRGGYEFDGKTVFSPAETAEALNRSIPTDTTIVCGIGHFWNFIVPELSGRRPSKYHFAYEFGAIAQAVPTGIGVSVAERDAATVVIEGDGSLLMNVQELETIGRLQLPVLVIVMNDGAYGAEFHKLPVNGGRPELAVFGWTDFSSVASSFGLNSAEPVSFEQLDQEIQRFIASPVPTLLDVRIDRRELNPSFGARFVSSSK